ncbi:enoyl-CoA hydratase/isomerase family protein [Aestuariimicrobium ganziense]|uniref:enoyl-CoA hydratase/isomerase family protein n=1 Tax=Aestuariimicrobium ganziense TaxID=2773677 RepID=UPI001941D6D8|nr:enoyl-CoA hydratase/isomerase family protein [Aestuariimicrobium ganziense]
MTDTSVEAAPELPVVVEVVDRVGRLTLNRPRAINALTREMIALLQAAFDAWRDDESVRTVELTGAGERGFCSGADVRALRQDLLDDPELAFAFLTEEYRLNATIADYPKPVTAVMEGITMGGGMGLSAHATHRVGTSSTQIAMPEVTIGFFPDVGVLHPMSRMPGESGTWMALTGDSLDASSALWAGLLTQTDELEVHPEESWLARASGGIDECFAGDDAGAIVDRLRRHDSSEARETAELIASRSPLSVAVSLEALRRASAMGSVDEVLAQDLSLARAFLVGSDFVEGVRAQLVDKDRSPRWQHASVDEVPRDQVLGYFG